MTLPALREREDLSWVVSQLLEKRPFSNGAARGIAPSAPGVLAAYFWPGNIRELVNVIDFACAVAGEPEIGMSDLPDQVFSRPVVKDAEGDFRPSQHLTGEDAALREDSRRMGWNVSATARILGIDRTTMHRRMRRLGVTLPPRANWLPRHTCGA